jgi:hypothetical protein
MPEDPLNLRKNDKNEEMYDTTRLVTSHYLSPESLTVYRSFISAFLLSNIFTMLIYPSALERELFPSYLTDLSYTGLFLYFSVCTHHFLKKILILICT